MLISALQSAVSFSPGFLYFLSEGHLSYYATVRMPDIIICNVIVSGYVTYILPNQQLVVNILFFHYW